MGKNTKICRKYDILIIADEVINGFGRTGKPFACELYGIKPDFIVLSKQITSSYMPMAAVLMTDNIYQVMLIIPKKILCLGVVLLQALIQLLVLLR
ncbi:MAG: hypothetical protein CM15mP109_10770 [Candidatus Dadabacteria bacterium]|nr:MAG: hypothetical protein CM15mP109_10770 [Candidatus Dadabacteria bacterium]